jgi:hypothetical protein
VSIAAPAFSAVSVGGLTYSIKSVSRASTVGPEFLQQQADGEFIIIRISVSNTGHDPATLTDSDFHLQSGNVKYDTSSKGMMSGGFFLDKLNPGVTKTGNLVFDVPANTSPSKYKLIVYGNGTTDHREIQL